MLQAGGGETRRQGDHQWQNSAASSASDTQLETEQKVINTKILMMFCGLFHPVRVIHCNNN